MLRIAVPALAGTVLIAYLVGERVRIDHDLRLVAPERVVAGQPIPVRAFLYGNLRGIEGARLVSGEVEATLYAGEVERWSDAAPGEALARTTLAAGLLGSHEGSLSLPPGLSRGTRIALRVEARVADAHIVASRNLEVGAEPAPGPLLPRALRALQRLAPGPIRAAPGQTPPDRMAVVVGGGACIPEQPCPLLVHVGRPGAAVSLAPSGSVTAAPGAAETPAVETEGAAPVPVVTHGPEAIARLRATRGGVEVATREVRLPVALGSERLERVAGSTLRPGAHATLQLSGTGPCILDTYLEGRLCETRTVSDCAAPFRSPPLHAPGIYRFQARRDPFSSDSAAVLVVQVVAADTDRAEALRQLAAAAARRRSDRLAAAVARDPAAAAGDAALTARYLRALLEDDLYALPAAVSGYDLALTRFAERRERARWVTIVALVFAGLCLGLLVARRGLSASAVATDVMTRAGDTPDQRRRRSRLLSLRVLAVMVAILFCFVMIALYVLARGAAP